MASYALINVSVSSHYREASYASELVSQGLLGEQVEVLVDGPLFSRIRQSDGYESWISSDQLALGASPAGSRRLVRSHFIRLRRNPDENSEWVRDAVLGSPLTVIDEAPGWCRVALPDGLTGWTEAHHFGGFPDAEPDNILALAHELLGYQYLWGGRTVKGFDCSGFVQCVFGLHGISLARDSWQQQESHVVSRDYRDAEPADLLFFARTPERVTHVAIAIGGGRFIHASGWVRYGSCNENDDEFNSDYPRTFVSVNRYCRRNPR